MMYPLALISFLFMASLGIDAKAKGHWTIANGPYGASNRCGQQTTYSVANWGVCSDRCTEHHLSNAFNWNYLTGQCDLFHCRMPYPIPEPSNNGVEGWYWVWTHEDDTLGYHSEEPEVAYYNPVGSTDYGLGQLYG